MTRRSLRAAVAGFAATLALLFLPAAAVTAAQQNLLVVITSAEPEVQGMAMVLSRQSLEAGAEVRILLCGPGGEIALVDAPQQALKPRNVTPQEMMIGLAAQGVTVEVCALYLPNRDKAPGDLVNGVGVAKPPAIAAAMLAPNTRLFTF